MMRLTVLGGAAAGGNPGQGTSGYLVQSRGAAIVLDLGFGTLAELRRHANIRDLDAVVISHLHLDHLLDLLALRYALAYNPRRTDRRLPVWLPPGGIAFLGRLADALADDGDGGPFFAGSFDCAEYDPDRLLRIGPFAVTFRPTVHYVPCWAMRVDDGGGGGALAYTADTGPSADLLPLVAGAEVLVTEGAARDPLPADHPEPFAARGHLTASEAGQLARDAGVATLVLSHLWDEHGLERSRDRAATAFDGRIVIARPGTTVEW
jgi:ribonuclease BN (tRNA processing enzyme)